LERAAVARGENRFRASQRNQDEHASKQKEQEQGMEDNRIAMREQAVRLHGRPSQLNAISPRARDHVTSSILSQREIAYCSNHHVSVHVKQLSLSSKRSITMFSNC
jgi:hypothetical protein